MAMEYTEEQLNKFDKATIVQLFLVQQSQLKDIDSKLQLVLEQLAVMNNHCFGKSSGELQKEEINHCRSNGAASFSIVPTMVRLLCL